MDKKTAYFIAQEILWAVFIFLAGFAILSPIILKGDYKYLWQNVLMIGVGLLYMRYIVFFKEIPYFKSKWVRIPLFLVNFHFIILILTTIQTIIPQWEAQSVFAYMRFLTEELNLTQRNWLINYVRNEVLFVGVAGIILILVFNARILASFFAANTRRMSDMLKDLE